MRQAESDLGTGVIRHVRRGIASIYKVGLLYWSLRRFAYWLAADVYYPLMAPLIRLADTYQELLSVVAFVARWTLIVHRLIPRRFLRSLETDTEISLRGTRYTLGLLSDEVSVFTEIYHKRVYEYIPDFIPRSGWTVFDLGANIGIFAVQQAQRGAKVYAFEPNPDCYRRLSATVRNNNLESSVRVFKLGLGSSSGQGTLRVRDGFTVAGTVVPHTSNETPANANDSVTIASLDSVVPSLDIARIDLLKIDTEGAEVEILRGAMRTLGRVERVVMEYHSLEQLQSVTILLQEHGFVERHRVDIIPEAGIGILYSQKQEHSKRHHRTNSL